MTQTELVENVIARILAEPRLVNMSGWACTTDESGTPLCDTVACIAGHVCMAVGAFGNGQHLTVQMYNAIRELSTNALGLPDYQADKLYFIEEWPEYYRDRLREAQRGSLEYAQVVADYLRDFFKLPEPAPEPVAEVMEEVYA